MIDIKNDESVPVAIEDVEYRRDEGGALLARLYRPSGRKPVAALVSVHGGRWVSQDRTTNATIDLTLAKAGILVMAVDFRMPPAVRYPEPIKDINFAIRWLKQRAGEYQLSPDLVGGLGTSSGGHQIMLNAMKPLEPRYSSIATSDTSQNATLSFAVACWPVLDPLARYRRAKQKNMEIHIAGHDAYWPDEASMDEGSPQGFLNRNESVALPDLLLIHGTGDNVVPHTMTERFAQGYQEKGGHVVLRTFADEPHTFVTNEPEKSSSQAALASIVSFILAQSTNRSD